ncbi:MAG TPA: hydrogenase maturation protease [Anaerolineaceae bacterium]|nr:hydrogenase maturation protease [Anaerolineaceae bacterium]
MNVIYEKTLIIGYGNPDRQDDGVAWHVLASVAQKLEKTVPKSFEEEFESGGGSPDFLFVLQLVPELAETLASYKRICFVDAHTGNVPDDIQLVNVAAQFQTSPFTHHMTAATCLTLTQTIYHKLPEAILVSVRGHQFGFTQTLSTETGELVNQAANRILEWLQVN